MYRPLILFLALLLLSLSGCGDSGPDGGDAGPPAKEQAEESSPAEGLPHDKLVGRLDEICKVGQARSNRGNKENEAELERLKKAHDYQGIADLYDERSGEDDEFVREMEALQPSVEDRSAFNRYLQAVKRQEGLYERLITALRAENDEAIQSVSQSLTSNAKKRDTAAIDLGLEECGQP